MKNNKIKDEAFLKSAEETFNENEKFRAARQKKVHQDMVVFLKA